MFRTVVENLRNHSLLNSFRNEGKVANWAKVFMHEFKAKPNSLALTSQRKT